MWRVSPVEEQTDGLFVKVGKQVFALFLPALSVEGSAGRPANLQVNGMNQAFESTTYTSVSAPSELLVAQPLQLSLRLFLVPAQRPA